MSGAGPDFYHYTAIGVGATALDAWGFPVVVQPHSLFHGMFTYDVPPQMWYVVEDGSENYDLSSSTRAYSSNGALVVTAAAGAGTTTTLRSRRSPRYQPNRGHKYSTAAFLPNKTADCERNFGLGNSRNGVFFRLKADGLLYGVIRNQGSDAEYLLTLPDEFDVEKGNIYDIQFQWRGVGDFTWYVGDPATGLPVVAYHLRNLGNLDALSIENPAMPCSFGVRNITENAQILVGCVDVTSTGGDTDREQYASYTESTSVGNNDPFLALRNPLTIGGLPNTRDSRLARLIVYADKKSALSMYVYRDPSLTDIAEGDWVGINNGSQLQYATTATTATVASMQYITTLHIPAATTLERDNPSRETIDFFLTGGDHVLFYGLNTSAAQTELTIELGDEI